MSKNRPGDVEYQIATSWALAPALRRGREARRGANARPRQSGDGAVGVRSGGADAHDSVATRASNVATALVLDDEISRAFSEALHHGIGEVVPAVTTVGIAAREDEEGRRSLDDDMAHVLGLGQGRAAAMFLDLESERPKSRHLGVEPPGFVLAATPLCESKERLAGSTRHHAGCLFVGQRLRPGDDPGNVRVLARSAGRLRVLGVTPLLSELGLGALSFLPVPFLLPLVDARIHPTFQILGPE
jgi:hypothetical protein